MQIGSTFHKQAEKVDLAQPFISKRKRYISISHFNECMTFPK